MLCKRTTLLVRVFCIIFGYLPVTKGAAPVCSPDTYTITAGIASTINTVFTSITCTDAEGPTLTYTLDTTKDGYEYFTMDSNQLKLVNRIDVEDGLNSWQIEVIVADPGGDMDTATVTVSTFTSTTTTTTTPPPPGYNWFDDSNNTILFIVAMATVAIISGVCVVMCIRFRRKGTCLPSNCPEFNKCKASFGRQVTCCPLPCDFYAERLEGPEEEKEDVVYEDAFLGSTTVEKVKKVKNNKTNEPKIEENETEFSRLPSVSPTLITNSRLRDVGFDGMREPGFNAPMHTSYGGKQ
ncbi:uncharacterized protein LOC128206910 [Mya arenaria]|uniref:uncharacterized protein LOC128206910 n=1 Tax=Mya arenaria TaxID=6604 RepID=UPI0022E36BFE|nr:uncharacterized protein LOC128206910 [Mya arenaria]